MADGAGGSPSRWRRVLRTVGFVGILAEAVADSLLGLTWRGWAKLLLLAACGVALVVVLAVFAEPLKTLFLDFLEWVHTIRYLGPPVLAAVYVVAAVLMVPCALLTLGAGFVFGLYVGFATVMVGAVAGAVCAFLLARVVLRRMFVADWVRASPTFLALDRGTATHGWKLVLLLRLSPVVPFNAVNYMFGLSSVSLPAYILCTLVGIVPGVLLFTYIGSSAKAIGDLLTGAESEHSVLYQVFFWSGLAMAALSVVGITIFARQTIHKMLSDQRESDLSGSSSPHSPSSSPSSPSPSSPSSSSSSLVVDSERGHTVVFDETVSLTHNAGTTALSASDTSSLAYFADRSAVQSKV